MSNLKLVPELYCENIEVTKKFYVEVFGFEVKYERVEEQFAYFTLGGVDIMAEGINGVGRRWLTDKMEKPFGRGVNFQWDVSEIDDLYSRVKASVPDSIYLEMEAKEYQCAEHLAIQKQFIVQDPDGYLFRFCCDNSNV
ncbi:MULTISPECIES: bleomycin resistance protein [unclassified Agarivorans]|uniref:bleomycin resistance protein n=1 Tax=unclassified Agarivorans TaxID=2636026 RepID=UPI0026E3F916|nr:MULTISPECIES: VOC family protein [unclassified Agarivorans]MDO6685005.1 VOC family protein [Agarivorans sp. 3_MG-2023]MDO6717437.1 VOC family protein [Agarivorans sp. 2_MG-2023]